MSVVAAAVGAGRRAAGGRRLPLRAVPAGRLGRCREGGRAAAGGSGAESSRAEPGGAGRGGAPRLPPGPLPAAASLRRPTVELRAGGGRGGSSRDVVLPALQPQAGCRSVPSGLLRTDGFI